MIPAGNGGNSAGIKSLASDLSWDYTVLQQASHMYYSMVLDLELIMLYFSIGRIF